jgi:two-component system, chemotaxis family, response regulator Rcp1
MTTNRILLIDDNPGDARLAQEVLKEANLEKKMQIDIISDTEEAEDFILNALTLPGTLKPDIIILDLNLPKKSGLELLKLIKSKDHSKSIPVIIMTTSDADFDLINAYSNHANAYIVKPPDFQSLINVMNSISNFWFDTVLLPK